MTYRPTDTAFAPPLSVKIPAFLYLFAALAAFLVVVIAESSPSGSWLYINIVERGVRGPISSRTVAGLLLLGGVSALIRANMRGVRVRPDGVEFRDIVLLGLPKQKRFRWAQINRIVLDAPNVILDLWDGNRAILPKVADRQGLGSTLEKVAMMRAIPLQGGQGLDEIPEADELVGEPET